MDKFMPLNCGKLDVPVFLARPPSDALVEITLDSPAVSVMTDLNRVEPVSISPHKSVEMANLRMMHKGVRLLLVKDTADELIGVLPASDILGERPLEEMRNLGRSYQELSVQDVMTHCNALDVLKLADLAWARVGEVLETFKNLGSEHILVQDDDNRKIVGIFSFTYVARMINQHKVDAYYENLVVSSSNCV